MRYVFIAHVIGTSSLRVLAPQLVVVVVCLCVCVCFPLFFIKIYSIAAIWSQFLAPQIGFLITDLLNLQIGETQAWAQVVVPVISPRQQCIILYTSLVLVMLDLG